MVGIAAVGIATLTMIYMSMDGGEQRDETRSRAIEGAELETERADDEENIKKKKSVKSHQQSGGDQLGSSFGISDRSSHGFHDYVGQDSFPLSIDQKEMFDREKKPNQPLSSIDGASNIKAESASFQSPIIGYPGPLRIKPNRRERLAIRFDQLSNGHLRYNKPSDGHSRDGKPRLGAEPDADRLERGHRPVMFSSRWAEKLKGQGQQYRHIRKEREEIADQVQGKPKPTIKRTIIRNEFGQQLVVTREIIKDESEKIPGYDPDLTLGITQVADDDAQEFLSEAQLEILYTGLNGCWSGTIDDTVATRSLDNVLVRRCQSKWFNDFLLASVYLFFPDGRQSEKHFWNNYSITRLSLWTKQPRRIVKPGRDGRRLILKRAALNSAVDWRIEYRGPPLVHDQRVESKIVIQRQGNRLQEILVARKPGSIHPFKPAITTTLFKEGLDGQGF